MRICSDLKLAQLASLTPEGFEEFVAEVFEALGYAVERVGGSGDEGADLRVVRRVRLLALVYELERQASVTA